MHEVTLKSVKVTNLLNNFFLRGEQVSSKDVSYKKAQVIHNLSGVL